MSKPNGKQPMERVAEALQNLVNKLDEQGEAIKSQGEAIKSIDTRLGKQDGTLRMIWQQCKGDPTTHLPIDD